MVPEKAKERSGRKSKKGFLFAVVILLLVAVGWFVGPIFWGYSIGLSALQSRFKSIRSVYQIDGFIEALDRFEKRYPYAPAKKDLEKVRKYVTKAKKGLLVHLVIVKATTSVSLDNGSENDVFIVISGPVKESKTYTVLDNNNPEFNFSVQFAWTVDCKPFIFDVNDDDVTTKERIDTVTVPCNGITGWRNLKGVHEGINATVEADVNDPPDCPW